MGIGQSHSQQNGLLVPRNLPGVLIETGRLVLAMPSLVILGLLGGLPVWGRLGDGALLSFIAQFALEGGALRRGLGGLVDHVWFLLAGLLSALAVTSIVWFLAVAVEASMIQVVYRYGRGRATSLDRAWRLGWRSVGQFIAIDTLLFFPLFLLSLFILVTFSIGSVLMVLALVAGLTPTQMIAGGLAGMVFEGVVLAVAAAVGLVTLVWRTVAFRCAIIDQLGPRASIRQAGKILRQHWAAATLLFILLWALQRLVLVPANVLAIPQSILILRDISNFVAGLNGSQAAGLGASGWVVTFLATCVRWLGTGVWLAFAAAAWTVVVDRWRSGGSTA